MKRTAAVVAAVCLLAVAAVCREAAVDWRESIYQALQNTITWEWKAKPLNEVLAQIAKTSGVSITLDASLPKSISDYPVNLSVKDDTLQAVLGKVLALVPAPAAEVQPLGMPTGARTKPRLLYPGLKAADMAMRYTLLDGGIFVSTTDRLITRLTYAAIGDAVYRPDEEAALVAELAQPLSVADALILSGQTDVTDDIPDLSNPYDAIGWEPYRKPGRPYVDPLTGITQFPAPPIWIEAENKDDPRYKFANTPSFLKPEYLWEEVYQKGRRDIEEAELLGRLTLLLKRYPNLTQKEVLEQFEKFLEAQSKK